MKRCSVRPYEGKKEYIFISYCHKDKAHVFPIIEQLVKDGYRVWYDEGIDPGSEWPEIIASHLNGCSICLAFISNNSLNSHNCRREINFALLKKKFFISVILEPVTMSLGMEMQLSSSQSIFKYTLTSERIFFEKLYCAKEFDACFEEKRPDVVVSKYNDYIDEAIVEKVREPFSDRWFIDDSFTPSDSDDLRKTENNKSSDKSEEAETEHKAAEEAERQRLEAERKAAEEAERQRLEAERKATEEAERQRLEAERKAAEEAERQRLEAERKAAEEAERQRLEAERKAAEEAERQRLEAERKAAEEAERQRLEAERKAAEEAERQRLEAERKAAEEAERQRLEAERKAAEEAKKQAKVAESVSVDIKQKNVAVKWQQNISYILSKYKNNGMYAFDDYKFEEKTKKAIENYAFTAINEIPLLIYDSTAFGSGKDGFFITDKHIYISIYRNIDDGISISDVDKFIYEVQEDRYFVLIETKQRRYQLYSELMKNHDDVKLFFNELLDYIKTNLYYSAKNVLQISHKLKRDKTNETISINKDEFVIGRSEVKADYIIRDNAYIGRVHAIVKIRDYKAYIIDQDSLNKTYLNGLVLKPYIEYELKNNDIIKLYNEVFLYITSSL